MTLSRQLILLIVSLVLLLFLGTFSITVYNTRDYLESQLGSHAQDAATSLGLSATSHFANDDRAMVTTMVNAMFHRGDYLQILLEDLSGEVWVERRVTPVTGEVPGWFVSTFALSPPERSATMMSGWRQVGQVRVISHPGLAYEQLWEATQHTLWLFLLGALAVLSLALLGLRFMLRPLKAVERQAEAICNRELAVSAGRPFTVEFRRVVEAMDRLSTKVSRMLSESEAVAVDLRRQAYQDPLTGLANRRQFMDILGHLVAEPDVFGGGGLLLVQLRDLKAFNQEQGYVAGDQLLADAAERLSAVVKDQPRATVAHLSGADFAVLVEGAAGGDQLSDCAAQLATAVASLYNRYPLASADVGHVGGVHFAGQPATDLLAEADLALREAQRAGPNAWVVQPVKRDSGGGRSATAWRGLLERAIERRQLTLLRQPVVGREPEDLLHREVFLRIADPDDAAQYIAAAEFMPMAESMGLAPQIDRAVVDLVLAEIQAGRFGGRIAVNLSPLSVSDASFVDWLVVRLEQRSSIAANLILEVPEYGVSADVDVFAGLIRRLSPLGVEFSVDHFGKGFASFGYLRTIKADYLKIDGSFIRQLNDHEDNRFFIKTVADIAHGLDMRVIAESVETAESWSLLRTLGVDGGRGYLFGRPE